MSSHFPKCRCPATLTEQISLMTCRDLKTITVLFCFGSSETVYLSSKFSSLLNRGAYIGCFLLRRRQSLRIKSNINKGEDFGPIFNEKKFTKKYIPVLKKKNPRKIQKNKIITKVFGRFHRFPAQSLSVSGSFCVICIGNMFHSP